MVMALAIVALLLYLIHLTDPKPSKADYGKPITLLLLVTMGITLVQIVLGTQVRQFVDDQIDILGENHSALLQNPAFSFYIHRSFSILVVLINGYLALKLWKLGLASSKIKWVMILIFAEVITGMAMYYLDFPFGSQPLHLVLASVLFALQFYLLLEALKSRTSRKTL